MNQGGSSTATIVPESKNGPSLSLVEPPPVSEEMDSKLDQAREQLLALRRQQEELERQKGDLEELRRKQDEYTRGKAEMTDKLTRGLLTLEREQVEAQRLSELCVKTTDAFRDYLEQIQDINDEEWSSASLRTELSSALGVVENSRLEYNRARTKLDCLNPGAAQGKNALPEETGSKSIEWNEMLRYFCIGAAAFAPLILAGTIWLIVLVVTR